MSSATGTIHLPPQFAPQPRATNATRRFDTAFFIAQCAATEFGMTVHEYLACGRLPLHRRPLAAVLDWLWPCIRVAIFFLMDLDMERQ